MKPFIKYIRTEGKLVILIPTKEGLEFLSKNPDIKLVNEKNSSVPWRAAEESVGSIKVSCLIGELPANISHFDVACSYQLDTYKCRFFCKDDTMNWYLNMRCGVKL